MVTAEADPQPLLARQRPLRGVRGFRLPRPEIEPRQDFLGQYGRLFGPPVLPGKIIVPVLPGAILEIAMAA